MVRMSWRRDNGSCRLENSWPTPVLLPHSQTGAPPKIVLAWILMLAPGYVLGMTRAFCVNKTFTIKRMMCDNITQNVDRQMCYNYFFTILKQVVKMFFPSKWENTIFFFCLVDILFDAWLRSSMLVFFSFGWFGIIGRFSIPDISFRLNSLIF